VPEPDNWSFEVSPAIGRSRNVWTKIVATDGEFVVSYIFYHKEITKKGNLIYEVDDWLADLWMMDDGTLLAPGEDDLHIYGNDKWINAELPIDSTPSSVWSISDQIFVTGEGCILQQTAGGWVNLLKGTDQYIDRMHGISKNYLFAVGRRGTIAHYDGARWSLLDSPTSADLNSLHVLPNGDVWIVGSTGTALCGNSKKWDVLSFNDEDLLDVVAFSQSVYVAAGTDGLYRIQEDSLVLVRDDIEANRLTTDGRNLYVSGGNAVYLYDGQSWESYRYRLIM